MPKNKQQLRRIQGINYCLNKWRRAKKSRLSLRFGVSEKTIYRDIKLMKNEYSAPITNDNDGYFYTENFSIPLDLFVSNEEAHQLKLAITTLNQFQHLDAFNGLEGLIQKIESSIQFKLPDTKKDFIYFESIPFYQGTELIQSFVEAIEPSRIVEFDYHSYKTNRPYHHVFHPYALKEHTNRWYVIGYLPNKNAITSFALERIIQNKNFKITTSFFKIKANFSVKTYFKYTYGMTVYTDKKIEEVMLSFSSLQAQYFKSKPFHRYETVYENTDELVVKMLLKPNYELIRKLAGMGNSVKILQPTSLINQLTEYHKKALNQYKITTTK